MTHIDEPVTLNIKTTAGIQRIIIDALSEVERAVEKHGDWRGRPLGTDRGRYAVLRDVAQSAVNRTTSADPATWVEIITEEVYEAFAEEDPLRARAELVQVLGVVMKTIESIDTGIANGDRPTPATVFGAARPRA